MRRAGTTPKFPPGVAGSDPAGRAGLLEVNRRLASLGSTGRRNLLDNGQMEVNQTALTTQAAVVDFFMVDRWHMVNNGVGVMSGNVATFAAFAGGAMPLGRPRPAHVAYMQVTTTEAAGVVAAGDFAVIQQQIEGFNVQHLNFGQSDAQNLTVTFDAWCSVAGTFIVELLNNDRTRQVSRSFTVAAGGWQTFTFNFPGDPNAGGVFDNDGLTSLIFQVVLVGGATFSGGATLQTSWGNTAANRFVGLSNTFAATLNNKFAVTNVQLEVGDVATPYEFRPFRDELATCQRYFERFDSIDSTIVAFGMGQCLTVATARVVVPFEVVKRAKPTMAYSAANTFAVSNQSAAAIVAATSITTRDTSRFGADIGIGVAAGLVAGDATIFYSNNVNTATIDVDARI